MVEKLTAILKNEPIVQEFHSYGKYIAHKNAVYIVTHGGEVRTMNNSYKLSSPVMCCLESLIMTYLLEFIGEYKYQLLPLAAIHDGIVFASKTKMSSEDYYDFSEKFSL